MTAEITWAIAPRVEADSWLNQPTYDQFREALRYASTQMFFILPASKLTAEEAYWVWMVLQCGMERTAPADETPPCGCGRCGQERTAGRSDSPWLNQVMVVCATCGNKRCPHAWDHLNDCTGSNEPGQTPTRHSADG